jgi:Tfp pilus assembly protein PilO
MLAALVVTIGVGLFFANKKLTAVAQTTSRLRAEIDLTQKQVDSFNLTKIKVESLGYANDLAGKVLPDDSEQSTVIAELSQFAKRANLAVAQISFADKDTVPTGSPGAKKTAIPKGVTVVPIAVKFKEGARYENLLQFLQYVENNQRRMQIVNIDLKPNDKDRAQLSSVTVVMNLYVKATQEEKKQ